MIRSLALLLALAATPALAVDPIDDEDPPPGLAIARDFIAVGDFAAAIPPLEDVISRDAANADAFNLLGFAQRKLGQLDDAGRSYDRALAIDPNHLGALEYQGELFLMLGDPEAAQVNLDRLTRICGTCPEREDLRAAIAAMAP